jgi:Fe-S oxidoreductase
MGEKIFLPIVIFLMILFSVLQAAPVVSGQNQTRSGSEDPVIKYAQTARELLNHTLAEYKKGNITGADELATRAYLDNFEYVESPLIKKKSADLKEEIEDMMRIDLRKMIKDKVPFEELNSQVNTTDSKLVKAIQILNDTVT